MLVADALSFGYPGRVVGNGVRLAVEPGQALALLGPNGGGKTTLLKTMLGLLPPLGGRVMLNDRPLADLPVAERARAIGYVPQAHAGAFAFVVLDVVLMGRTARQGLFASPTAGDRRIAETKLVELGIAHLADKPYTMISGGERQLVLIARALAQEPAYVVLDEPTASLDFGNQGKVMRQIGGLAARGLGVLFTTHDPNQALRHAHRVALLAAGGLIAAGPPSDILTVGAVEALYGTGIERVGDSERYAFLPL
jgi:iron complex transport system ATP-binding protein